MIQIDQTGLGYVRGGMDIVADETGRIRAVHVPVVVPVKSVVAGEDAVPVVALPAQSIVAATLTCTIVVGRNIRRFQK
jgi:hypothetical protein